MTYSSVQVSVTNRIFERQDKTYGKTLSVLLLFPHRNNYYKEIKIGVSECRCEHCEEYQRSRIRRTYSIREKIYSRINTSMKTSRTTGKRFENVNCFYYLVDDLSTSHLLVLLLEISYILISERRYFYRVVI